MKKLFIAIAVVVLAALAAPAFAAMNPFMDVPASHWAYDAVAQLASRGVVSGYPDGTFKGPQPATRYEIASIIARTLAYVDMEHASKQDVEMLKRLIVEFSDELNALGVKVDDLDSRLGTLHEDLGGWRLSGEFDFRANFGGSGQWGDTSTNAHGSYFGLNGRNDFDIDTYRIYLDKRVNETTWFHSRFGKANGHAGDTAMMWQFYYITTKLAYDVTLDAGRFETNWEDALGLVGDDDFYVGAGTLNGFRFSKDWGMANAKLLIARGNPDNSPFGQTLDVDPNSPTLFYLISDGNIAGASHQWEAFLVAANIDFVLNEKFQAGLLGYYWFADSNYGKNTGDVYGNNIDSLLTVGVYAKFRFHPSVELKGVYYNQKQGNIDTNQPSRGAGTHLQEDTANAWKAILAVDQDLLKFTSLQVEYAQINNNFNLWNGPYTKFGYQLRPAGSLDDPNNGTTQVIGVKAAQKWGETKKWDTWQRYYMASYDIAGVGDIYNIGIGIGYQLNPDVHFALGYDYVDWGSKNKGLSPTKPNETSDHLIRFNTTVAF